MCGARYSVLAMERRTHCSQQGPHSTGGRRGPNSVERGWGLQRREPRGGLSDKVWES